MENFLINTTGYKPIFPLGNFVKKSAKNYRLWLVEDLLIFSIIFLRLCGKSFGMDVFGNGHGNWLHTPGLILLLSSVIIGQLWDVCKCQKIRRYARWVLENSVVLVSWREVRKLRHFLLVGILFTLANIVFFSMIFFVPKYHNDPQIIIMGISTYLCMIASRLAYFILLGICHRTLHFRGHWSAESPNQCEYSAHTREWQWK